MKSLIKSGLLMALGWLATRADGQEFQRWSPSKNADGIIPVSASKPGTSAPVGLGRPTRRQDPAVTPASFQPIIRGQSDEITIQPLPKVETAPADKGKVMPKAADGFVPPQPTPVRSSPIMPSPIWDSMGVVDGCGTDGGGYMSGGRWGGGLGMCGDNGCCPDRGRRWASVEYLLWYQRAQVVPPLITSSPLTAALPGVIGQSTTTILYDQTPNRTRGGGRFTVGSWLPNHECWGAEISYFFLARQDATARFGPSSDVVLARPFFSSALRTNNAEIFNDAAGSGSAWVNNFSQLWGIEANLRRKWNCGPGWWVDALVGYRHVNLSEGIAIHEEQVITATGTRFVEDESFNTRNLFNGGQVGLDSQWRLGSRFSAGVTAKIAFGCTHQIVNIDGSTTRTLATGATETQRGALLALEGTNIGRFTQNKFAVLPEIGVRLAYDVTDNLSVFAGYNFMYLSNVVRPGDQIDLRVNSNFRPFTARSMVGDRVPAVLLRTSDYWAQGLTFGMQYKW